MPEPVDKTRPVRRSRRHGTTPLILRVAEYRRLAESHPKDAEPLLVVGALPLLPVGVEITPADDTAFGLLQNPPNQPTFGRGTWGLKPLRPQYGELITPVLDGLVRELKGNLAIPRLALHRNGYFELRVARLLDPDSNPAVKASIHPALLVSHIRGFLGVASAIWQQYRAGPKVAYFLSIVNTAGTFLWGEWPTRDLMGTPREPELRPCPEQYSSVRIGPEAVKRDANPDAITQRYLEFIYNAYGFRRAPDFTRW